MSDPEVPPVAEGLVHGASEAETPVLARKGRGLQITLALSQSRFWSRQNRIISFLPWQRSTLDSARFRALLLDVLTWIEGSHDHSADQAGAAATRFATDVLRRQVRKVLKQGKHLAKLSARGRHKVRIRVKKIRYAVEFFESLFPKRRRKPI